MQFKPTVIVQVLFRSMVDKLRPNIVQITVVE